MILCGKKDYGPLGAQTQTVLFFSSKGAKMQETSCEHPSNPPVAAYRSDELFLRNGFESEGRWGIPIVGRQELDLSGGVELIASSDTSPHDTKNLHKGVHHFVDDTRLEDIYRHPERTLEKYARYRFVLTPDYSLFPEMPLWRQIESVGKSRWCGAWWQRKGLTVIPTIGWGLYPTFEFCFAGVEKGSIVAVSTLGCRRGRARFMHGYDTMLERIEPEAVICFGRPFAEMSGSVLAVDYMASRKTVR